MAASSTNPSLRERAVAGVQISIMTAAAAWISYASTAAFGLHEGYWAAISAIVVIQQDLAATRVSARDRFIGTAIGGVAGWLCALCWHQHMVVYVLAVAVTVLLCWLCKVSGAGRLAAVAVSVIVLIPRSEPIWKVALLRSLEVSWGIAVAVVVQSLAAWMSRRTAPRA